MLLDQMLKNMTHTLQMEDPEYAAAHGLSVVHFTSLFGPNLGDWSLLCRPLGRDSGSLHENDKQQLPTFFESQIEVLILSPLVDF